MEVLRRLDAVEGMISEKAPDEKLATVLSLYHQSESAQHSLVERFSRTRSFSTLSHGTGSTLSLDTPDRRPSWGLQSPVPDGAEIPSEGPGRSEAAGRHFGILGAASGNCEAARQGGRQGGAKGEV